MDFCWSAALISFLHYESGEVKLTKAAECQD